MGATPYKDVSFASHDVITTDKLNQVESNLQWIQDNTPRSRAMVDSVVTIDSSLVLVSGKVYIPRSKYSHTGSARVNFGPWFKSGTEPHITTGIISDQKKDVYVVVNGIGRLIPDHRGMDIAIEVMTITARPKKVNGKMQADVPDRYIYVCWQAMGERPLDV